MLFPLPGIPFSVLPLVHLLHSLTLISGPTHWESPVGEPLGLKETSQGNCPLREEWEGIRGKRSPMSKDTGPWKLWNYSGDGDETEDRQVGEG